MPPPAIALEGVGQGTARRLTAEARTPPPPPAASSPWSKELRCSTTTDAPPVLNARPATSTDAIAVEASLEIKPRAPSVVVPEVLLASLAGSTPLLLDMFKSMDRDHDGSISFDEFRTFCHRAGLADEDAAPLFAFFDRRGDGVLTVREMMAGNRLLRAHVAAGQDSFEETLAGYMEYDDGTAAAGGDGGATPRRPSRTTSISPVTVGTDATPERQRVTMRLSKQLSSPHELKKKTTLKKGALTAFAATSMSTSAKDLCARRAEAETAAARPAGPRRSSAENPTVRRKGEPGFVVRRWRWFLSQWWRGSPAPQCMAFGRGSSYDMNIETSASHDREISSFSRSKKANLQALTEPAERAGRLAATADELAKLMAAEEIGNIETHCAAVDRCLVARAEVLAERMHHELEALRMASRKEDEIRTSQPQAAKDASQRLTQHRTLLLQMANALDHASIRLEPFLDGATSARFHTASARRWRSRRRSIAVKQQVLDNFRRFKVPLTVAVTIVAALRLLLFAAFATFAYDSIPSRFCQEDVDCHVRVAEILTSLQLALSVAQSVVLVAIIPCVLRNNSSVRVLRIGIRNVRILFLGGQASARLALVPLTVEPLVCSLRSMHALAADADAAPGSCGGWEGRLFALVTEEVEAATLLLTFLLFMALDSCVRVLPWLRIALGSALALQLLFELLLRDTSGSFLVPLSQRGVEQSAAAAWIARIDWALLLVALAALAVTLRRPFTLAFLHVPCDLQEFHAAREDQHRKKKRLGAARAEFLNVRLKLSKKLLSSSLGSAVWRVRSSEGRRRSSTRSDERETAAEPSEGRRTSRRRTSRASRDSESGSRWSLRVSTPRAGGPSGALPPPSPRSASLPPMATIRSSVVADSL